MSKDAPKKDRDPKSNREKSPGTLSVWLKVFLSLLFAAHLLGVFIAPLNSSINAAYSLLRSEPEPPPETQEGGIRPVGYHESEIVYLAQGAIEQDLSGEELRTPEDSGEAIPSNDGNSGNRSLSLYELYQPYLNLLYLNHGYGFFSPDPGPSHLIRYTIEHHDGTVVEGVFPNLHQKPDLPTQWPRLRYHRHFMLAEQIIQPSPRGERSSAESYARYLQKAHHAKRVRLERVEHRLPTPEEVLEGVPLDAPESYRSEGTVVADSKGKVIWE